MSFDVNWDVDKYKEDFESDEQWELRKAFMERWKTEYPEDRLVCLARIFANIEFLGCRYPNEVMLEVARLSEEIVKSYRNSRKNKLKRTFVSASTAAEDRAKGIKREGGIIADRNPKLARIKFVTPGNNQDTDNKSDNESESEIATTPSEINKNMLTKEQKGPENADLYDYIQEMSKMKCLNVNNFQQGMFNTEFGRMVLLIRPWSSKLWNIQASCQASKAIASSEYIKGVFSLSINGRLVAQASGETRQEARSAVEIMAWNRLRDAMVSVVVKEQFIPQGDSKIGVSDVSGPKRDDAFGTPIESSVAAKMMQMMGWTGGGLGVEEQGIAEPIKPNLQMVNRAGLGSNTADSRQLRRAGLELMQRFRNSDTLDVDLVFTSDFTKDERVLLHQCAKKSGLASRSYGDKDRFLVVRKKLDPFSLVQAVIEKGGNTPKYQVFIPAALQSRGR